MAQRAAKRAPSAAMYSRGVGGRCPEGPDTDLPAIQDRVLILLWSGWWQRLSGVLAQGELRIRASRREKSPDVGPTRSCAGN